MAKIMLVEDDNNLREIYGARLLAEGHEIVAAKDGEEALALAVKEKPELIISDVMMPRISGFDMLDILRNAPETKNTKVIMMTALSQAEDKARADKLGADRYLVKSQVTLEDVAKAVNDVLAGTPATSIEGASGAQTTDPTPVVGVASATPTPATSPAPAQEPVSVATPPAVVPDPIQTPPLSPTMAAPVTAPTNPVPQPPVAAASTPTPEPTSTLPSMSTPPAPVDTSTPPVDPAPTTTPPAIGQTPTTNPVSLDPPLSTLAPDPSTAIPPPPPITPAQPVTATPPAPTPSIPAPEPATTPSVAPPLNPPTPTSDTPIKVELPAPPAELLNPTTPSTATENPVADTGGIPSVGPNLAEALQQEATDSDKAPTSDTGSLTPEAPSIVNGAEDQGIIKPTMPKPEEQPDEPPSRAEPHTPENPLDDTPKKKVIEPINDLTKKPDLAALAAAEEGTGTVLNPGGEAVVAPAQSTEDTPPATPAVDDHSKIAL